MRKDNKEIIDEYVALPFAIENIELSIEEFIGTGLGDRIIYELDLIAALKKAKSDYYLLKNIMRFKYGLDIKQVSTLQYVANGEIIRYKPKDLRSMSEQLMMEYIKTRHIDKK